MTQIEDLTPHDPEDSNLIHRVKKLISSPGDEEFSALALDIFKYQFERNHPYAAFARSIKKTPETKKIFFKNFLKRYCL